MNFFGFFQKGLALNAQTNPDIEKHQLPDNGTKKIVVGNIQALKFIKPQAQGSSSNTWGVVRRELGFKYWKLIRAAQSRPSQTREKSKLN